MKLIERIAARRDRGAKGPAGTSDDPADPADPAAVGDPGDARVHITGDGGLVIDLRPAVVVGGPARTTDMRCPNCDGELRVDALDWVSHRASMSCAACGFAFAPRLHAAGG